MRQMIFRFSSAVAIYCLTYVICREFLVFPGTPTGLTVFVPPIIGLMWGSVGALGTCFGYLLVNIMSLDGRELVAMAVTAYLPYKLWHTFWFTPAKFPFAFDSKTLIKFIGVNLITFGFTSAFIGLTSSSEELSLLFAATDSQFDTRWECVGLLFLNGFDLALFFGVPWLFILISHGYNFYVPTAPGQDNASPAGKMESTSRFALIALHLFFVTLFVILDASGLIYDLDRLDTWIIFNAEELTMMNVVQITLIAIILTYRHSIVTNLILLVMTAIFIASFILGSIGFAAINTTIGDNVRNDLEKTSVIYRERLVRTFSSMIATTKDIGDLSITEIDNYERFRSDSVYRRQFLSEMQRRAVTLTKNSPGSIACYMVLTPDFGNDGFLCHRKVEDWGKPLPEFIVQEGATNVDNKFKALADSKMAKLSEPYWYDKAGGYVISYVFPISHSGQHIGIVGVDMDFNYLVREVKRMSIYEHGYVRLMDKHGETLYSNESRNAGKRELFYETEAYLSNGFWLKIGSSAREIYADRNFMLMKVVVGTLLIAMLVTFFSLWLAKKATRPLQSVAEATRKIAAGDLDVKISYAAKNELGILVQSITEMVAKLEIYVYRDKLTGLLNVAAYARKVKSLEERQAEDGQGTPYAVAVFDANFLKRINDTYGHEAGNELIVRAADMISRVFNDCPVYRIGGDEFAAVLENKSYEERASLLYKFDHEAENEYFFVGDQKIMVSVARGMAVGNTKQNFNDIFQQADAAMYKHKAAIKARLGITSSR